MSALKFMKFASTAVRLRRHNFSQAIACAKARPLMSFSTAAASPETATHAKLVVTDGGKRLQTLWDSDGGASPDNYHAVWLRQNCQCGICKSPHSRRKTKINPELQISKAELNNSQFHFQLSLLH